jgi:pimeloyl-ACP methyl ester carboxylesterase
MENVEIQGLRIVFERAGDGPLVVLLHGGVSDGRERRRQIDDLYGDFTGVAWDAPGCGRSWDPPESFRMADYADCLASLIDSLELGMPHVVGLSFGGALALELYRRHPALPRMLVLASAYAGWAGSLSPDVVAERLEGVLRESELPSEVIARRWIPGLLTDQAPAGMVDELVAIISDLHPAGFRTMARARAEADLRPVLSRIDVPTLLIYGDADSGSPLSVAEELHAQIPGSRLVVLPGAGHQNNIESAERFNAAVREFLASQPRDNRLDRGDSLESGVREKGSSWMR